MVSFPPCKINLGLNITRKRADGFHDIETCFYPVPWTDIIEFIASEEFAFTQSGSGVPGSKDDNLCVRAFRLFQRDFGCGNVKIHLHKIIPVGAGLGGGSSDAAHSLLLLNTIFNTHLDRERLSHYASLLGSDCTFFIHNEPMIGMGRGNELHDVNLSLKDKHLVLIHPPIHISTAEAYANVTPAKWETDIRDVIEKMPVYLWREFLVNDFEASVFQKYPLIKQIKDSLYKMGALYAAMSGSGSSVFGIFENNNVDMREFAAYTSWSGRLSL